MVASVKGSDRHVLEIEPRGVPRQIPEPAIDFLTLLNALRALQDQQATEAGVSRSLIPLVLQRFETGGRQGPGQIQSAAFQQPSRTPQCGYSVLGGIDQSCPPLPST